MMFLVLVLLVTVCNALDPVYIDESPCVGEDTGILISPIRAPPGLLLFYPNLPAKYSSFVQRLSLPLIGVFNATSSEGI